MTTIRCRLLDDVCGQTLFIWLALQNLALCRAVLIKDWETTIASSEAWLHIAAIRRARRLIARKKNLATEF
jgi:hypothetical protein